jgi:succinate dehydrogenase / fumarate reductase flavoprotein subunit
MGETRVHDTDVLVVGGGFAGTWAAIRAAELGARVILAEKAVVARSGASTLSSGVTNGPTREDDLDLWVEELVRKGDFMVDQRWTRQLLTGQLERLEELEGLGDVILKDENGRYKQYLSRGMVVVRGVQYSPKLAMELLRDRARELGVEIINRLSVVDLITSDRRFPTQGRVCGAVGFDTRTGQVHVFNAGSVVLASGPLNVKGYNPVDNDTGDGMAMALRVGALVVDAAFSLSGTFNIVWKNYRVISLFNIGLGHGLKLVNAHGERFMERYDSERLERSELAVVVAAFVQELLAGRGPVYMDLTSCDDEFWENLVKARGKANADVLFGTGLPDPRIHPIQIEATRGFWSNGRCGPKIDLDCRTTVPGLLAAGAVAKNDANGTHGSAGVPTAFAMVSGHKAGETAAREAMSHGEDRPPVTEDDVRRWESLVHAPLYRIEGMSTDEALDEIRTLQGSVIENFQLDDASLAARLEFAAAAAARFANITARDPHDLVKAHEFASSYRWIRCCLAAMRDRTESRIGFIRQDYPYTDDFQWRCWHGVRETGEGFAFERIPFPQSTSGIEPPPPRRYLDPVAGLMNEAYAAMLHGSRAALDVVPPETNEDPILVNER